MKRDGIYSTLIIVMISSTIGGVCAAADVATALALKPGAAVGYQRIRTTTMDGRQVSQVTESFTSAVETAPTGVLYRIVFTRLQAVLQTPAGETIAIDTQKEKFAEGIENPMARTMVQGLDKLLNVPLALTVDKTGAVIDSSGIDAAGKLIPGCSGGPGMCSQLLLEAIEAAQHDQRLLPAQPLDFKKPAISWSGKLVISYGAGVAVSAPVNFKLDSFDSGVARVSGISQLDPKTIPESQMGKASDITAKVNYTFDTGRGCFRSQELTVTVTLEDAQHKTSQLVISSATQLIGS